MDKILLATSLAPVGLENQKAAVQSWIDCGFEVISCNIQEEIDILENEFPMIEFVEMKRDGRNIGGKPCPYIYDILNVLKQRERGVTGIINSDIHLRNFTKEMQDDVVRLAQDNVVFLHRQEISSLDAPIESGFYTFILGVDVFFLHDKNIDKYVDIGMIIGQSMWDYWFLIAAKENGIAIKELVNPVAFHVSHPIKWNHEASELLCDAMAKQFYPKLKTGGNRQFMWKKYLELISDDDIFYCHTRKNINSNDFEVSIPYAEDMIYLSPVYKEMVCWTMETYQLHEVTLSAYYWMEKTTGYLSTKNGREQELQEYRKKLQPIRFVRRNSEEAKGKMAELGLCTQAWYIENDRRKILEQNKVSGRVVVFPAGNLGELWVNDYHSLVEIVALVDNSLPKGPFCGKEVLSPAFLEEKEKYDQIIVITTRFEQEIYEQALQYCEPEKIICWREIPQ
ncbi:MAG: hypothetical protein E7260_05650 [Lachnospiraceae bacterium]|nr:hypothetical protein [Lachnospiraceae bacterium]